MLVVGLRDTSDNGATRCGRVRRLFPKRGPNTNAKCGHDRAWPSMLLAPGVRLMLVTPGDAP